MLKGMTPPRRPALGNDPLAALGLATSEAVPRPHSAAKAKGKLRPESKSTPASTRQPVSKSSGRKTTATPAAQSGRKRANVSPPAPPTTVTGRFAGEMLAKTVPPSISGGNAAKNRPPKWPQNTKTPPTPTLDIREIEKRLEAAFRALDDLPLPEGAPPRDLRDEAFETVRSLLRLFTPTTWWRIYHETILAGRSLDIDPFGLDPVFEERAERLADFLYRRWWRVEAHGVGQVPAGGRALLVSNHSGMLPYDGAMIKHAIRVEHPARRTVRFLVENFVFYFPFLGTMVYRYGGVRASMDNALRLLADNQLTAVFPEGVKGLGKLYRQRYQLQRFGRGGFIKLAIQARAPIIPVAVVGAEEIHPIIAHLDLLAKPLRVPYVPITPTLPLLGPLGLVPLPTKWHLMFGEPLLFPLEYGPEEADNEILINELTLRVRRMIHAMIYARLAKRRSVFFG